MAARTIYKTAVLKDKQVAFLKNLQKLSISKENVSFVANGDYFLYEINLSNQSNCSYLWDALNEKQLSFL